MDTEQTMPVRETKRQTQISQSLEYCSNMTIDLFLKIDELEKRLNGLCRDEIRDESPNKQSDDKSELVPIASSINEMGRNFKIATDKIRTILDLLEI